MRRLFTVHDATDADVTKQGGAYATGVLVLMSSAGVATVLKRWPERRGWWLLRVPWYFLLVTVVFFYTTVAIVIEKPDGIKIAACFVGAILASSMVSRTARSTSGMDRDMGGGRCPLVSLWSVATSFGPSYGGAPANIS